MIKYITRDDVEKLMLKHDHLDDLTYEDVSLLISRFDKDADGRIGINEVSKENFKISNNIVLRTNRATIYQEILN